MASSDSSTVIKGEETNGHDAATDDIHLGRLFDAAHEALLHIEASDLPSNDAGLQRRVAEAVKDLEWATLAASKLDLFSRNEDVEELPTSSLKFLLLPVYLGRLTNKKAVVVDHHAGSSGSTASTASSASGSGGVDAASARKRLVDMTVIYLEDYLTRLGDHGVFLDTIPTKAAKRDDGRGGGREGVRGRGGPPDLKAMNAEREAKIRRFKESKEREERLKMTEARRKKETLAEEEERKYWLDSIEDWTNKAVDDLKSLQEERDILAFMAERSAGKTTTTATAVDSAPPSKKPGNPFAGRPFILTRDAIQRQVFGMGYPSLPTMTVEEWYEEQAAAGLLPTPDQSRVQMSEAMKANDPEVRQAEEERKQAEEDVKAERDDDEDEERRKKIEWDEWKDDHRRGWGNRKNMG